MDREKPVWYSPRSDPWELIHGTAWSMFGVARTVQVFRPTPSGRYDRGELLEKTGTMASQRFPGLTIDLATLFLAGPQND